VPQRWYYRDLPAVQISRWSTLPQVLERLLADPSGLAERSRQMMSWWAENPAEPAVARYVAASLGHLSSVPNPVSGVLTRG
jgi:hypothetical protein